MRRRRNDDPAYVPDEEEAEDNDSNEEKPKRLRTSLASTNNESSVRTPSAMGDAAAVMDNGDVDGIANPPLKIASFNIQVFGQSKMKKKEVIDILMKILQRYDIILILEIRDSSQTALNDLVDLCNECSPDNPFLSVVSARLGRTSSKEQYGFMYRKNKMKVTDTFQFDDGVDDGTDIFQREPFAVRFNCPSCEIQDFAIIATHTAPDEADKEVGALHKVYFSAKRHWNLEDIIIAGDFNADEGYISREGWSQIVLKQDKRFTWLIEDWTDTTTGHTDRAYDRFVVAGDFLTRCVVPHRTKVFNFDDHYGLTPEETLAVSDHYPIEMQLCGKVNHVLQQELTSGLSVTVAQLKPIEREHHIRQIYRAENLTESADFTSHVNYDDSRMLEVVACRKNVTDVAAALKEFQSAFPNVLEDRTIDMVGAYLSGSSIFAADTYIYGLSRNTTLSKNGNAGDGANQLELKVGGLDVKVTTKLQDPLTCSVTVTKRMS